MSEINEREAFEKWYSNDGVWSQSIERNADGEYSYAPTAVNWIAWQARAALAATPAADDLFVSAEIWALRDVYEQARGVLRYDGIDQQRAIRYRDRLIEAIETVKTIDGGNWEPPTVAAQVLPEPVGYLVTKLEAPIVGSELKINRSIYTKNEPTGKHQKLYTEQQVRALLATGGQGRVVDAAKHPLTGNAEWQIEEAHKDLDRMGIPRDDGEDNYSVWGRFTLAFEQIAGMRIHIPYTDPDKPVTYESVGAAAPQ